MIKISYKIEKYCFSIISVSILAMVVACAHTTKMSRQFDGNKVLQESVTDLIEKEKPVSSDDLSQYMTHCHLNLEEIGAIYDEKTNLLFISGFDVNDMGRYYFAAANPVTVSCFEKTRKLWSREISRGRSRLGLLKYHDRKILFIDEEEKAIKQLSDDGKGSVASYVLPVTKIERGSFTNGGYYILDSLSYNEDEMKCEGTVWEYTIPNVLRSKKTCVRMDASWYTWITSENDTILLPNIGRELSDGGALYVYKGEVSECKVYISSNNYGNCTIAIQSKRDDSLRYYDVPNLPPYNVVTSIAGDEIVYNNDYDILKNGNLYLLRYNQFPDSIVITEVNIASFIQNLDYQ